MSTNNEIEDEGSSEFSEPPAVEQEKNNKLTPEERFDAAHALEHLFAVGAHNQHRSWRVQEFKRRRLNDIGGSSGKPDANFTTSWARPFNWKPIHADDAEAYRQHTLETPIQEPCRWPEKRSEKFDNRPTQRQLDKGWYEYYGDTYEKEGVYEPIVEPVPWCGDAVPPMDRQPRPDTWSPDVSLKPAPGGGSFSKDASYQLILRCWRRAINAAALEIPLEPEQPEIPDDWVPNHRDTVAKCTILRITGPENEFTWTCPSCDTQFLVHRDRLLHFYGSKTTRGCAWKLIQNKQKAMIKKTLVAEASYLQNTIMKKFLSGSILDTAATRNWEDVLKILSAPPAAAANSPAGTETASRVLDEAALKNTELRLIERYASLPL